MNERGPNSDIHRYIYMRYLERPDHLSQSIDTILKHKNLRATKKKKKTTPQKGHESTLSTKC